MLGELWLLQDAVELPPWGILLGLLGCRESRAKGRNVPFAGGEHVVLERSQLPAYNLLTVFGWAHFLMLGSQ